MKNSDLEAWGARAAAWSASYLDTLGSRPVRPQTRPGEVRESLAAAPPVDGESIESIFTDFENLVVPHVTNWQHPRFFAYFPSNSSPPSVLAEWLTATLAAQCMLWQTSPAGTEMEVHVLDWLRQMTGIGEGWHGVIQTGAGMATLSAILTAREKALDWAGKEQGLAGQKTLRVYTSLHAHSSVEKAVFLSGIGRENLVKIEADETGAMRPEALRAAIAEDRASGYLPCALVAVVGGTGVGYSDRFDEVLPLAREEGLFTHVDAAWAGSALICPEFRGIAKGIEMADSMVMNPHKWLMTNFDCSAHFVKSVDDLQKTMSITPAYLVTQDADGIQDYSQITMELGRRFRALKLWFVIRAYGVAGLQKIIRDHVAWAEQLAERLGAVPGIELTSPVQLGLFSFRLRPEGTEDGEALDRLNAEFLDAVNGDGTIYLTQTVHEGRYIIRVSIGTTATSQDDIDIAFDTITRLAAPYLKTAT